MNKMKAIFFIFFFLFSFHTEGQYVYFNPNIRFDINEKTYDSLAVALTEFINSEDSVYVTRNGEMIRNPYWLQSDFDKMMVPFGYFMNATMYYYKHDSYYFKPSVMSISKEEEYNEYLARIAYIGRDADSNFLKQICVVAIVKDSSGNYKLKHPIDLITKYWKTEQVGNIKFKVNHNRVFNIRQAKKLDSFNTAVGKYFHILPYRNIVYYSCKSYLEMWKPQGYEYCQAMYSHESKSGGLALPEARIIFSGNNSEYYPHELVHIYTNDLWEHQYARNGLLDEGIATYFGGSEEKSLLFHLKELSKYIKEKNIRKVKELLELDDPKITEFTDVKYTIGGLMAKLIDQKAGYKGLIKVMNIEEEKNFQFLANIYNMPESKIDEFLLKEIKKYE
jgi:hypothetical protein